MQVWCFPFSSEGKARRSARALAERGFHDLGLLQRAGVWHITAPTDSALLGESRFFLSGKGLTLAPLKVSLV